MKLTYPAAPRPRAAAVRSTHAEAAGRAVSSGVIAPTETMTARSRWAKAVASGAVRATAPPSGRRLTAAIGDAALASDPTASAAQASDRKSTRLNSSHVKTSYAVFCDGA